MTQMDLKDEDKALVQTILKRYIPDEEVWVFGSRVRGEADPCSDLDLVIVREKRLPRRVMLDLKSAFCFSDLHFIVDLLEWYHLSSTFHRKIEKHAVVIQKANLHKYDTERLPQVKARS